LLRIPQNAIDTAEHLSIVWILREQRELCLEDFDNFVHIFNCRLLTVHIGFFQTSHAASRD
jgi:hypothetical protein